MDKLGKRLRTDAERIEVSVSEELEQRLDASLRGVVQDRPPMPATQARPAVFWWASSLTGAAAALLVIAVINSHSQPDTPPRVADTQLPDVPVIDWKTESAMLTEPLRQELENLQSDLRKAEEKVKQDIGL